MSRKPPPWRQPLLDFSTGSGETPKHQDNVTSSEGDPHVVQDDRPRTPPAAPAAAQPAPPIHAAYPFQYLCLRNNRATGFTLLELSIVMLVIATVIGGIVVAKDMIRNVQSQKAIREMAQYTQAVNDFRDKYQAWPGDFTGATALWGARTNDGDGSGWVGDHRFGDEDAKAWEHLVLAGFTSFMPTGGSYYPHVIGKNMPPSALGMYAGYRIESNGGSPVGINSTRYGRYGTYIYLGTTTGCWDLACPVMSPEEAMQMDSKVDDGRPATGQMISVNWWADNGAGNYSQCNAGSTSSQDAGQNQYNLAYKARACDLEWWILRP